MINFSDNYPVGVRTRTLADKLYVSEMQQSPGLTLCKNYEVEFLYYEVHAFATVHCGDFHRDDSSGSCNTGCHRLFKKQKQMDIKTLILSDCLTEKCPHGIVIQVVVKLTKQEVQQFEKAREDIIGTGKTRGYAVNIEHEELYVEEHLNVDIIAMNKLLAKVAIIQRFASQLYQDIKSVYINPNIDDGKTNDRR